jgi:hypothetical protein
MVSGQVVCAQALSHQDAVGWGPGRPEIEIADE